MRTGGFADECLLSRPTGTLSSILNGGEGWGEEVPRRFLPVFFGKWLDLFGTNWLSGASGATNPVTVPMTNAARFYRLVML